MPSSRRRRRPSRSRLGARLADPVSMYLSDACTLPVNMAGLPGICIPAGLSEGLPVGLQLIGAPWSEPALFGLARGYEAITATADWRALEPADLAALDDPATPTPAERLASLAGARGLMETELRPPLAERALAERVQGVPPSGIRRFFDIAATMDDVISLGVGEPDFDTPRVDRRGRRRDRCARAGRTTRRNYGTLELRRALVDHLERRYGVRYDPATELLITVGASEARRPRPARDVRPGRRGHPPRAVVRRLRPGDRLRGRRRPPRRDPLRGRLRARPGRRRGGHHAADEGAVPGLPVQPDRRGPPGRRPGRAGGHRRSATTCSCTATRSTTASPTATYRHRAMSALPGMRERTILMGGFSKAYAMTGWRVGYVAAPAAILEGIVKVHQYGIMSAPTTAQDAALVALVEGEPDVERMLRRVRPPPAADRRRAQRPRSRDVRAARRVLRLPADHLDRPDGRGRSPSGLLPRSAWRSSRGVPSGRRAPATSGCATRPRTSGSRRPSAGSAGSWSASGR